MRGVNLHCSRVESARGPSSPGGRRERGFTLVEMLVVIAIISLISFSLISSMGAGRQAEATRAANQIAATMRFAFDKARTEGAYYRLEIDLDEGAFVLQRAEEAMYMPATTRDGKLAEPDPDKLREQEERDKRAAESYFSSIQSRVLSATDDAELVDPYAVAPSDVPRRRDPMFEQFDPTNAVTGVIEPIKLPERVKVLSVRTEHDFAPITEGKAYVYFFPQGRTQMTHVQLEDAQGDRQWTIMVQPLTGRVSVIGELIDLELPDDRLEEDDELGETQNRRSF